MSRTVVDGLSHNDGFRSVRALRALADDLEAEHVVQALAAGWSWAQIAEALDVTRQAVQKKHGHRIHPSE
ncbi:helix-turn-helix domain-containing protein [Desertimonas flava]|uniref:helix-turn-helix domain-containing protein n=1 Tax=Desertimonas flava TaxID=2064846 RepID=UPI000E35580F